MLYPFPFVSACGSSAFLIQAPTQIETNSLIGRHAHPELLSFISFRTAHVPFSFFVNNPLVCIELCMREEYCVLSKKMKIIHPLSFFIDI